MYWVIWLDIAMGVVLILLFGKLSLCLTSIKGRKGFFVFTIKFCGVRLYTMTLYFRLKKGLRPEIFKVGHYRFQKIFSLGRNSRRRAGPLVRAVTRGALRTLKIDQFMLAMRIGTEDAALCALLCGALAGVIDAFLRVIPNEVRYAKFEVVPMFDRVGFFLWTDCIFSVRFANIINANIDISRIKRLRK